MDKPVDAVERPSGAEPAAAAQDKRFSRRRFLFASGLFGAGAALAGAGALNKIPMAHAEQSHASADATGKHQWVMVIDLRRCDGCEKCTKACQQAHYLGKDQKWIRVYDIQSRTGQKYFMPRLCMHCENAPCVKVCPTGATFKDEEGVTLVNQSICIGCRTCMAACPYEARYFNWEQPPAAPALLPQPMPEFPVPQQKGTVGKCVLCVHNTDVGKLPVCVEACTMEALYIGDLRTDTATNGRETVTLSKFLQENDAIRYREELGTQPRVWYIMGHGQDLDF